MRLLTIAAVWVAWLAFLPGVPGRLLADSIIISQGGIWGSGADCPPTYCNAPADTWNWSFEMSDNPVVLSFDPGNDFEAAITNFQFSDNGIVIASLTNSQTEITFFSTGECGGLQTDDLTTIDECTDQLYSGMESAPTMQPGTYPPLLNPQVGDCGGAPFVACATVTFGNIVIADLLTATPEPSSALIIIAPLLVLALVIRKRRAGQTPAIR